jgi:hypothetical protein
MENLIHKLIEQNIKGVDTYQHNGSTWLIFTNDKRWVIELTEDKTLWYNYTFFKSIFDFFSIDVVENQSHITKWVENNIMNKVRHTTWSNNDDDVEHTIKNGVKETTPSGYLGPIEMNGKIVHQIESPKQNNEVEDTIKNGVKETLNTEYMPKEMVEETIKNGVKETNHVDVMKFFDNKMEFALQNGIKETNPTKFPSGECGYIREILRNGIKEAKPLPAQDGNRDWGNYYHGKEDRTKPFNEYLNEAIRFGIKDTNIKVD